MPEPITVWTASPEDPAGRTRGTLSLREDSLVFEHDKGRKNAEIPLRHVHRVKRGFASPVIVVEWQEDEQAHSMAIFFAKPPPLDDPMGARPRTHRRRSAQYLVGENAVNRRTIKEWRQAIATAAHEARRGEG